MSSRFAGKVNAPDFLATAEWLNTDGRYRYVADSEASAIRHIDSRPGGHLTTIGEGLFDFGGQDGIGPPDVRLQHPTELV